MSPSSYSTVALVDGVVVGESRGRSLSPHRNYGCLRTNAAASGPTVLPFSSTTRHRVRHRTANYLKFSMIQTIYIYIPEYVAAALPSLAQPILTRKSPKRILTVQTHLVQVISTTLTRTRTLFRSLLQSVDILHAPIAPHALPILITLVARSKHSVRNACVTVRVAARCYVWCV